VFATSAAAPEGSVNSHSAGANPFVPGFAFPGRFFGAHPAAFSWWEEKVHATLLRWFANLSESIWVPGWVHRNRGKRFR
jgi:hypothetical protein